VEHVPERRKIVRLLPLRPDPDHLAREAKALLRAAKAGESSAVSRMQAVGPDHNLATAQLAVAREYGFPSWPKLKAEVDRRYGEEHFLGGHARPYLRMKSVDKEDVIEAFSIGFDEELMTDREIESHVGVCNQCHSRYAFETNIVRGFADHIEAYCPKCGASLGTYREDWSTSILVRLLEEGK
jgi:hypothetical protein